MKKSILKLEWTNLEIDIKALNSRLESLIEKSYTDQDKEINSYGIEAKTKFLTEKELKKLKKSELIKLALQQNEIVRDREDSFTELLRDMLINKTEDLEQEILDIPDEITKILDDFKRRSGLGEYL